MHPDPAVRRGFLVALTTLVLWTVGYLAYTLADDARPTAPEGPRVPREAGENPAEDAGED